MPSRLTTWILLVVLGMTWSVVPAIAKGGDESSSATIKRITGLQLAVVESYIRRNITSSKTRHGFKVRSVAPGSIAAKAGVKKGDILLLWHEKKVKRVKALAKWALAMQDNSTAVEIEVARRRKRVSLLSRKPWEHLKLTLSPRR